MNKMKNVFFAALLAVLTVPSVALAQWSTTAPAGADTLPVTSVFAIISNIMNWLLAILGFVAVIGFVIAGIMYLTAGGDAENQKKAKNQMLWSIQGVVVALIGWVVVMAAQNLLSGGTF